MKKLRYFIFVFLLISSFSGVSQTWNIEWERVFRDGEVSFFTDVISDRNNGYTALGSIRTDNSSLKDFWLVRMDETGDTIWTKTYQMPFHQFPKRLIQAADGGYLLTGSDWDKEKIFQLILIKTDLNGNEEWRKNFGDSLYYSGEDFVALE
ncbi:MAG: hypothetical protein HQ541_12840, partial [Mariniphaga sp.]|nr:hypothetical protein [Mariniphaga sp.]